jgi:Flp pilus assembly protein TadD
LRNNPGLESGSNPGTMDMKKLREMLTLFGILAAAMAASAQTPPPASPAPAPTLTTNKPEAISFWTRRQMLSEQKSLREKVEALEASLQEGRRQQARIADDLKNAVSRMDTAQKDVQALQARLAQLDQRWAQVETNLPALKAALARQEQMLIQMGVKESNEPRGLEARLAEEQKKRELNELIIKEREKEIKDLREALAARDAALKMQATGTTSPAAVVEKPIASTGTPAATTAPSAKPVAPAATGEPPPAQVIMPGPATNPPAAAPTAAEVRIDPALTKQIAEGNRLLREGQTDKAEQNFKAVLAKDPQSPGARMGMAACLYSTGDLIEARRMLNELIKTDPNHSQALGLLGLVAWRENDLDNAVKALVRAIQLDPTDAQLHNYLGIVLHARNEDEQAVAAFNKSIELNPDLAETHFNLAVVLASLKAPRIADARKEYERSLRLGNAKDSQLEKILYP